MIYQLDATALMYIATSFADGTETKTALPGTAGAVLLTRVGEAPSTTKAAGTKLAFQYRGPKDTVLRSVIFSSDDVKYAKITKAADMRKYFKKVDLTVTAANNAVVGYDYSLRVSIPQPFSFNPNEIMIKDAVYHAKTGDTLGHVIAGLAYQLFKGQNEPFVYYKIYLDDTEVTKASLQGKTVYGYAGANSTAAKLTIEAFYDPAKEWKLKYSPVQVPTFTVSADVLNSGADEEVTEGMTGDWVAIAQVAPTNYVVNGYETADREFWYLVSNGTANDQDSRLMYRTETMVTDPTKEYNYLNIHVKDTKGGGHTITNDKDIIIASTESMDTIKTALEAFGIKVQ